MRALQNVSLLGVNLVCVALSLSGCADDGTGSARSQTVPVAQAKPGAQKTNPAKSPPANTSDPDCVRGAPEKLLRSGSEFKKTSEREAIEVVQTNSPLKLAIRHFGCTNYALEFEFTWPGTMPGPSASLREAAQLLNRLPVGDAYKPLAKSLVSAFEKMANEPYKQPLTMSETDTLTATTPSRTTMRIRYEVAL